MKDWKAFHDGPSIVRRGIEAHSQEWLCHKGLRGLLRFVAKDYTGNQVAEQDK